MSKKMCSLFVWCLVAAAPVQAQQSSRVGVDSSLVSMVELLSRPEKFVGKRIRFRGYLCWQFENKAVYLSKEFSDNLILESAVGISMENGANDKAIVEKMAQYNGRYVTIEGEFNVARKNYLTSFQTSLSGISMVNALDVSGLKNE